MICDACDLARPCARMGNDLDIRSCCICRGERQCAECRDLSSDKDSMMRTAPVLIGLLALVVSACSGANPASPSASPLGASPSGRLAAATGCAVSYAAPNDLTANPNNGKVDVSWTKVPAVDDYMLLVERVDGSARWKREVHVYPTDQTGDVTSKTTNATYAPPTDGRYEFRIAIYSACTKSAGTYSAPKLVTVTDVEVDRNVKPYHPNNGL